MLKHARTSCLRYGQIASIFLFAVGLLYGRSFRKRAGINKSAFIRPFCNAYLGLIGIVAFLSAADSSRSFTRSGRLLSIGVAAVLPCVYSAHTVRACLPARAAAGLPFHARPLYAGSRAQIRRRRHFRASPESHADLVSGLGDLKERGLKAYTLGSSRIRACAAAAF